LLVVAAELLIAHVLCMRQTALHMLLPVVCVQCAELGAGSGGWAADSASAGHKSKFLTLQHHCCLPYFACCSVLSCVLAGGGGWAADCTSAGHTASHEIGTAIMMLPVCLQYAEPGAGMFCSAAVALLLGMLHRP
jgi:hypothetical protein